MREGTLQDWQRLDASITSCRKCPRLCEWREQIGREKRAAFRDQDYWARPIPNLGSPDARLLIVGLAPAAHGGNRTGRMFTGDRSGDFLFRALHEAGFANQPTSTHRDDGLELIDLAMTAVAHCAPPANKPTTEEIAACADYLQQTLALMPRLRGIVCLGKIAFDECVRLYRRNGWLMGKRPHFAHGLLHEIPNRPFILGCYHPSQQNTFTGKLTATMMDDVFKLARTKIEERSRTTCSAGT